MSQAPKLMAYVIGYTPGSALATITYSGHLSGAEVAESIDALVDQLAESPARLNVLCDTREATSIFTLSREVERTAQAIRRLEKRAPTGRGAYIGGRNHAVFLSLVRVVLKLVGTTGRERGIFTDYDEALAWVTREA